MSGRPNSVRALAGDAPGDGIIFSMRGLFAAVAKGPRNAARAFVWAYRHTLSALVGRHCRHLPTCSEFADEAFARYGFWAGGWMTLARLSRCHPWGTSGLDFVPERLPEKSRWFLPWRYGRWRDLK